jgi:hypothetical protein
MSIIAPEGRKSPWIIASQLPSKIDTIGNTDLCPHHVQKQNCKHCKGQAGQNGGW